MMKRIILGMAAITCMTSAALAPPLVETEPNDTIATADFIGPADYPTGAFAFDGAISPGDVDFISFDLTLGDFVGATLFDFQPSSDDSTLGVFDPSGALFLMAHDSGLGLFVQFTATATGTWSLAVTGMEDHEFIGKHKETFNYKLIVGFNPVPAPAAFAMFGLAGLLGRRRRA